jgi:hypothetical protein
MSVLATDSFTGADENPISTGWAIPSSFANMRRVSNALANSVDGTLGACYKTGVTWPANQYSQLVVTTVGGGNGGPAVRISNGGNAYCLQNGSPGAIDIYKFVGGSATLVATVAGNYATNDILYLGVEGTTLTAKINGATIITASDASLASGSAGANAYNGNVRLDDFEGGDIAAVAGTLFLRRPQIFVNDVIIQR